MLVRKDSIEYDAIQINAADFNYATGWDGFPFNEIASWIVDAVNDGVLIWGVPNNTDYSQWSLTTLEEEYWAGPNDWLLCDAHGELHFCSDELFEQTYEIVHD